MKTRNAAGQEALCVKRTNDSAFTPAFTVRKLVRWAKAEMFVESHPDIQTLARRKPSRIVGVEVVRRPRLLLLAHVWQQCEHPTPALALATCCNVTTVRVNAGWCLNGLFALLPDADAVPMTCLDEMS